MAFINYKKLHNIVNVNKVIIFLFLIVSALNAQLSDEEFFSAMDINYFSLETSGLKNFSTLVTSNVFRENMNDVFEKEVSPLELIWSLPDKLYFIKQPLPAGKTDTQYTRVDTLQIILQSELSGIFFYWQRFIGGKLLTDIPQNYLLSTRNDSVTTGFAVCQVQTRNKYEY